MTITIEEFQLVVDETGIDSEDEKLPPDYQEYLDSFDYEVELYEVCF